MTFEKFKADVVAEAKTRSGRNRICVDGLYEYFVFKDFEGGVNHAIDESQYFEPESATGF